jgi:hypothetical protein
MYARPRALMVAVLFVFLGAAFCAYFAGQATAAIHQARQQQAFSRFSGWPAVGIAWLPSAYFTLLLAYLLINTPSFDLPFLRWTTDVLHALWPGD